MKSALSRRRLLATTVLAGAGAMLAPVAARALTLQKMDAEGRRQYLAACGGDAAWHESLVAEAERQLAGRATRQEIEAALRAMTCPLCGCPVVPG